MIVVGQNGIADYPKTDFYLSGDSRSCVIVPIGYNRRYYRIPPAAGMNILPFAVYGSVARAREILLELAEAYERGNRKFIFPDE